jgi:hypothetical protein
MNKEKEEELIKQLQSLNEVEFCSIFYKVVAPLKKVREELGEVDDAFCISVSGYSDKDHMHGSFFWALPLEGIEYFSIEDQEIGPTQFGQCSRCKVEVVCISKSAICPICDTEIDCT